jgi:hypothetical protein
MRVNNLEVGPTPVRVPLGGGDVPIIVNDGNVDLYFGSSDDVSAENGIPLGPSSGYEFSRTLTEAGWPAIYVVAAEGVGDVRYGTVG